MTRRGGWIQTFTGRTIYPVDPREEEVEILDIIHSLANLCRFGGHCSHFYSVAEHSVHVSYLVPEHLALVGLLHDATEAYLVDIPRPIKASITNYKEIEHRLWECIAGKYDLPLVMPQEIHDADIAMLYAERDQLLLPYKGDDWGMGLTTPITERPVVGCWTPTYAKQVFMQRWIGLTS